MSDDVVPTPRRLAVVSDAVSPWNTGGKERRHHELLTRLADRGWTVDVYTMNWWRGARDIDLDGIHYHAICRLHPLYAGPRRSLKQAVLFMVACFRLSSRSFDVVEVDAIPFLPLLPMRLVTAVKRRPMVVTWHEYWGRSYWVGYLGRLGRIAAAIENLCLRLPTRIIAASAATGERLQQSCPHDLDIAVIPAGIDGAASQADVRTRETSSVPRLICVGRLLSHKNVDAAVAAVDELRRRGTEVELTIVGEGPELEGLRRLVERLGLSDLVHFVPFLDDHTDVLGLVAESDLMLFPSNREGFGMVALEAMSLGVPVVTSDHVDNFARFLVEHGVSGEVSALDPRCLADSVQRVLGSREAMSRAARRAATGYDWDVLAGRAAQAYAL